MERPAPGVEDVAPAAPRGLRLSPIGGVVLGKIVGELLTRASVLGTVAIVVHYDGSSALGAWSQLQVIVALLGPFAVLGLANAMVPMVASRAWTQLVRRRVLSAVAAASAVAILLAAAMAITAGPLNDLILDWHDGAALFRWGAALVIVAGVETLASVLLQARGRLRLHIAFQVAQGAGTFLAAALALSNGADVVDLVVIIVVIRGVLAGVALGLAASGPEPDRDDGAAPTVSGLVRFGLSVAAADAAAWAVQLSDRLVYGHFGDAASLGGYAVVYSATGALVLIGAGVFLPAYPRLVAAWAAGGRAAVTEALHVPHHLLAYSTMPVTGLLFVIMPAVFHLLDEYDDYPGDLVVALVLAAVCLSRWNGLTYYILVAAEGGRGVRPAWFAGAAVAVVAALALVPAFDLLGAAIATVLSYAVVNVMMAARARHGADLVAAYEWRTTVKSVIATAGAVIATRVALGDRTSLAAVVVAGTAFAAVYVVAMAAAGETPMRSLRERQARRA